MPLPLTFLVENCCSPTYRNSILGPAHLILCLSIPTLCNQRALKPKHWNDSANLWSRYRRNGCQVSSTRHPRCHLLALFLPNLSAPLL